MRREDATNPPSPTLPRKGGGGVLALALILLAAPAMAETVAVLQGLDKTTARISKFEAPLGKPVTFGSLTITVRACNKRPPEEPPESAAFLEIDDKRPGDSKTERVFSGWMFASSPALSAMDHPVYDVGVLDCKNESGSSGSSGGK
jgi:hypothetical protein